MTCGRSGGGFTFVLICIAFLLSGAAAQAADSYIDAPGNAARAVATLVDEMGRQPLVHSIRITDDEIALRVSGQTRPGDLDEWTIGNVRRFFLDFEVTAGPRAFRSQGLVANEAAGLFPLADLALGQVSQIAAKAKAYARLEGQPTVQSIEIGKQISILPQPEYGDVRWAIYITTDRESATVRTDAAGNIVSADLSNTNRARLMDMVMDDDWPKEEALADLAAVIGPAPRLREFSISPKSLSLKVDHATLPDQVQTYGWTISGVTGDPVLFPLFPGTSDAERFSLVDVDLSKLAAVRQAALTAWDYPQARINYMALKRFSNAANGPELRWVVSLIDVGVKDALFAGTGTVEVSPTGSVRTINLPRYRQKQQDFLTPTSLESLIDRLRSELGSKTRFAEITVHKDRADVRAEDQAQPGKLASYSVDGFEITRSTPLMPWSSQLQEDQLFSLDDLAFFKAVALGELTRQTYERLGVRTDDMAVSRYTFSVGQLPMPDGGFMLPSPDGKVTLEIRLEAADGWKGGRVTYNSHGEAFDIVTP
ncbi:hypothetical protein LXM94_11200 [Rhizobium sp. TRM95111]|uniref:hypothetical protein n=1 Tax=Rhizobium alarense TaxID=2846851 RepID=UPI001F24B4C9|nr:hypothetical protein [Rhizobium alarense]MCF3640529.1 hypothetical protein [Rhizobium alarense]